MSSLTMSQRIEAERKDMKLGEVKELNLDGCSATDIEGLTDEYSCLEKLSMADVGLTTLAGLPTLPSLTYLNVSGNPISGGLEALCRCSKLASLNLSGNKLSTIADLAPLASLENLSHLELGSCDLVSSENYRKEVFALLPQLKYLDGLDQNGVEEASGKASVDAVNGVRNGHVVGDIDEDADASEDQVEDDEDEENEDASEDEGDDEEEIGISALQESKDLEDDEEDYVPGEAEDDDEEDEEEEEEADEDDEEDENVEDEIADLSGSVVTEPRRAHKRPAADADGDEGVTEAKIAATEEDDE